MFAALTVVVLAGCNGARTIGASASPASSTSRPSAATARTVIRTVLITPSPSRPNVAPSSVPPTESLPTPNLTALIAPMIGSWHGHDRSLTISPNGVSVAEYRVFKWCSQDPTPPCDEMQGNIIIDGGRIVAQITSAYYAGTALIALGQLVSSTDPAVRPGPMTMRLYQETLSTTFSLPFCGAQTAPGACGA